MKVKLVCQEWLDEFREARLCSDDLAILEFADLAAKVTEGLFTTLREHSPGLMELLTWLDAREAEYDVATEHEIGVPALGHHGRAARLLRFFQAEWAKRGSECDGLRSQLEDLHQKLIQTDERHHEQLLAIEDGARQEAARAREYLMLIRLTHLYPPGSICP
jgi:hypothetical protein